MCHVVLNALGVRGVVGHIDHPEGEEPAKSNSGLDCVAEFLQGLNDRKQQCIRKVESTFQHE